MSTQFHTAADGQSGNFGLTTGAGIGFDVEGLQDGVNLLINSAGKVNQRGYVSGAATSASPQFTVDRWFIPTSGQALSWVEAADGNYRLFNAPASGMVQVVEAAKIQTGKYVASWGGSGTCFVNGVERFNGVPFDLSYNAATNVVVKFVGPVSKMRLERGRVPTRFGAEDLDVAEQGNLCLRYLERGSLSTTCDGVVAYTAAESAIYPKRATPSFIVKDGAGNLNACSVDAANSVPAQVSGGLNSVRCNILNSVRSTNAFVTFNWEASAEITS